jgi:hypothetical protein
MAAASGRIGTSSFLKSTKMLIAYFEIVSGSILGTVTASTSLPYRRFISASGVGSTCQTPDRSGLPSAVRGGGAVRFGLPSLVRGMPGVG